MPLDITAFEPKRLKIRRATHAVLSELAAFESVFNARTIALRRAQLPACRIFIARDEWRNDSAVHDLGWFRCTATLTVQVIVEAQADPDTADKLDVLCGLAQHALISDFRWREHVLHVDDVVTDIAADDQGEQRTMVGTIEMSVTYTDCAMRDFGEWGDGDPLVDTPGRVADYRKLCLKVDVLDPAADPNTAPEGEPPNVEGGYPGGYPGPDGRIEVHADIPLPGETEWDDTATDWPDPQVPPPGTRWDDPR